MASGLTRILDPDVPSNRFVLVVTPVAGAIAGLVSLVSGEGLGAAVPAGFSAGGVAFLAWAIGREVDPDRPLSACLAAIGAPLFLLLGPPDLLGVALILLAARMVAGTTGRRPVLADVVVLIGGAGLVAARPMGPAFVATVAVAMAVIGVLDPESRPMVLASAVGMVAVGGVVAWWTDTGPKAVVAPERTVLVVLIVGTVASVLSVVLLRPVRSPTDRAAAGTVRTARVRWARATVGVAAVAAWMWVGDSGVAGAAALWSSLAGTLVAFAVTAGPVEVRMA